MIARVRKKVFFIVLKKVQVRDIDAHAHMGVDISKKNKGVQRTSGK